MRIFLLTLSILLLVGAATAPAAAATITSPGVYNLTGDITGYDTQLRIASSNVVLDGMGHTIAGANADGSYGVEIGSGAEARIANVVVRNMTVRAWDTGIGIQNTDSVLVERVTVEWCTNGIDAYYFASNGTIRDCAVRNNLWYGIALGYPSGGFYISKNDVSANRRGIDLDESREGATSWIVDNTVHDNRDEGISVSSSAALVLDNVVRDNAGDGIAIAYGGADVNGNTITGNGGSGIDASTKAGGAFVNNTIVNNAVGVSPDNTDSVGSTRLWNNYLNNTENGAFYGDGEGYGQQINTTKTAGPNIVGGPLIGGNYWGAPDGRGFSDLTPDANGDGFCDAPYRNPEGAVDSLPLANPPAGPVLVAVPGGVGLPRDLDGSGLFRDVNGNGRHDFADVVLYFDRMTWIAESEPLAAFDYNRNGRIDFADVVSLFEAM